VFVGDWNRYLHAFDVKTGDLLWQTRASASVQGYPISYAVAGRQYIAVPVGIGATGTWFGLVPNKLVPEIKRPSNGNAIVVFALPQPAQASRTR
jgi:alcohol dehydrogenase (cytochrome c)